jgi:hypothetical protein
LGETKKVRMKHLALAIVVWLAVFLAGCSMPTRIVIKNNSASTLVIDFADKKQTSIKPGRSGKILLEDILDSGTVVSLDGRRCDYRWVRPVAESGHGSMLFRLNLEPDRKIYLMKPGPIWTELRPMSPQPPGFPLTTS